MICLNWDPLLFRRLLLCFDYPAFALIPVHVLYMCTHVRMHCIAVEAHHHCYNTLPGA
jgi:hypothetical protein